MSNGKNVTLAYDWHNFIMEHQCLVYTGDSSLPPGGGRYKWDYFSYPFIQRRTDSGETLGSADFPYRHEQIAFPWPSIVDPETYEVGVKCMDYKHNDFDWDAAITSTDINSNPLYYVAQFLNWTSTTFKVQSTLFGGWDCSPCPDCNRTTSTCVKAAPVPYMCSCDPTTETCTGSHSSYEQCEQVNPIAGRYCRSGPSCCPSACAYIQVGPFMHICARTVTAHTKTCYHDNPSLVCQCNGNYCGKLCHTPLCPIGSNGTLCSGRGTCSVPHGTDCDALDPGQSPGTCSCNNGYKGDSCELQACTAVSSITGTICGNGTCNLLTGQCNCNDGFAGEACDLGGCARDHLGRECSGALRIDNGETVCNRATRKCECYRTVYNSRDDTRDGWPQTDSRIYLNGRYGETCEFPYGTACRNPQDGTWCGVNITSSGSIISNWDGYAGCYNDSCDSAGGELCKPFCHCTTEFVGDFCDVSRCGTERCGVGGECDIDCYRSGSSEKESSCNVEAINDGLITVVPHCHCKVVNGIYYYHNHSGEAHTVTPCSDPAQVCYTGTSTSPCNKHGECAWNSTSNSHFCKCDTGWTGANCSAAPLCYVAGTSAPCVGGGRICSQVNGANNPAVCTCSRNYQRDANLTCADERCVATGGQVGADGNCNCPEGRPIYSSPPLDRIESPQTFLGCRKGCPMIDGVPCGAFALNGSNMCQDLLTNDPIFYSVDSRPAPTCSCGFVGKDRKGNNNYFIDDPLGSGTCVPMCNPDGLCSKFDCPLGIGITLAPDLTCQCSPGFSDSIDSTCNVQKCDTLHGFHLGNGKCECVSWCRSGPDCKFDLCSLSGGVCQPSMSDCDCSSNPVLRLNTSVTASRGRNCTSACQNGGLRSGNQCICPAPFFGPLCETRHFCKPQWGGTYCNISQCLNGGTPRPASGVGCVCTDKYFKGQLCELDMCVSAWNCSRVNGAGECTCNATDSCSPGGSWNGIGCVCRVGFYSSENGTSCLPVILSTNDCSGHGEFLNFTAHGAMTCFCQPGWEGVDCSTPTCTLPLVALEPGVCTCPAGSYWLNCKKNYCNSNSLNYSFADGCICKPGFAQAPHADITGTRQCVDNPYYCYEYGTSEWSNISNPIPCKCKFGYYGPRCKLVDADALLQSSSGSSTTTTIEIVASVIIAAALLCLGGYYLRLCSKNDAQYTDLVMTTSAIHSRT